MAGETPEHKAADIAEAVAEAAIEAVIPAVAVVAIFDLYRHDVTGKAHDIWHALHELVAKAEAKVAEVAHDVIDR